MFSSNFNANNIFSIFLFNVSLFLRSCISKHILNSPFKGGYFLTSL